MTGLIVKDFLILRKTLRTYLLMIFLYAGLSIAGVWGPEILGGFLMIIVAMLPMNVFAYDKQSKWDVYGLALPVSRTRTVAARYICVLILCLVSTVFTAIAGVIMTAVGRIDDFGEYVLTGVILGLLSVVMNAVLLPFLYKFGPDKARVMFLGFFGLIFGAGWLFLFPLGGIGQLKYWEPTSGQIAAAPFIAALVGLVLLALSFLLSRHFYGAKDV